MAIADGLIAALRRTGSLLSAAPATDDPGFPGISPYYYGQPWPLDGAELDFPVAAKRVPTVFACQTQISNDMASLPLRFYRVTRSRAGEETREPLASDHPLVRLMARANPVNTGFELRRDEQWSRLQNGNGYFYLERFGLTGPPQEIWEMPGHLVRPVPGPRRSVRYYEWLWGSERLRIAPEDVIQFRYANPNALPLEPAPVGLSPLEAARLAYETRHHQAAWQRDYYQQGARIANVYSIPPEAGFTINQAIELRKDWEEKYGGRKNAFKPQILLGGMKVERAGLTLDDMKFIEAAKLSDADVCMVYRMPPEKIGVRDGSALSDGGSKTYELAYVTDCLMPQAALFTAVLNERLCPLYGDDIVCEIDFSSVLAIQSARLDQAKALQALAGRPILTLNEARTAHGDPESDDPTADELLVPFNMMLASDLASPSEPSGTPPPGTGAPAADGDRGERGGAGSAAAASARATTSRMHLARTPGQLEAARRQADADLSRYERRMAAAARAFFSRKERVALERLEQQARAEGMDVEAAFRPDELVPEDEGDVPEFQRLYAALIAERGEAAGAEVGAEVALEVWSGRLGELIRGEAARLVTGLNDTTRANLAATIEEAVANQETFSQLAARVREVFDGRRANALTIARTETGWAYNLAAREAWTEAGIGEKEWLTVGDEAVRDSHSACEAEGAIPMSALFSNGLAYPGDRSGDPSETINCRCVLQPVVVLSDSEPAATASTNGHRPVNRLAHLFART